MRFTIYKKINYRKAIGKMILNLRMANNNHEKIAEIYKKNGLQDREGNYYDLEFQYQTINEESYQTNRGIEYSKNFPRLDSEIEKILEIYVVVTKPSKFEDNEGKHKGISSMKGENFIKRIEAYKEVLVEDGFEEEDLGFYQDWIKSDVKNGGLSLKDIIEEEDYIVINMSDVNNLKEIMNLARNKIFKKYNKVPLHWVELKVENQ